MRTRNFLCTLNGFLIFFFFAFIFTAGVAYAVSVSFWVGSGDRTAFASLGVSGMEDEGGSCDISWGDNNYWVSSCNNGTYNETHDYDYGTYSLVGCATDNATHASSCGWSSVEFTEPPPAEPPGPGCGTTQCSDCVDNDGDGAVDMADTECSGSGDDNEGGPFTPYPNISVSVDAPTPENVNSDVSGPNKRGGGAGSWSCDGSGCNPDGALFGYGNYVISFSNSDPNMDCFLSDPWYYNTVAYTGKDQNVNFTIKCISLDSVAPPNGVITHINTPRSSVLTSVGKTLGTISGTASDDKYVHKANLIIRRGPASQQGTDPTNCSQAVCDDWNGSAWAMPNPTPIPAPTMTTLPVSWRNSPGMLPAGDAPRIHINASNISRGYYWNSQIICRNSGGEDPQHCDPNQICEYESDDSKYAYDCGWNSSVGSKRNIVSGDGYFQFVEYENRYPVCMYCDPDEWNDLWNNYGYRPQGDHAVGLNNSDTGTALSDIDFGILVHKNKTYAVIEDGSVKWNSSGTISQYDTFRIEIVNGVVKYKRNGGVFYTSTKAPTYPLYADAQFYGVGTVTNTTLSGNLSAEQTPTPPPPPSAGILAGNLASHGATSSNWSYSSVPPLGQMTDGYNYRVWLQVEDQAGNKSGWVHQDVLFQENTQQPEVSDVTVTEPDYCAAPLSAAVSWTYSDPNDIVQAKYQMQIDDDSGFASPEYDSGIVTSSNTQAGTGPDRIAYNKTYYSRVKVWNSEDTESEWANGQSWNTPNHMYPSSINISYSPDAPNADEDVAFSGSASCGACASYEWDMGDGASASGQEVTHAYSQGAYSVGLTVSDGTYSCSKTTPVNVDAARILPKWKEVLP